LELVKLLLAAAEQNEVPIYIVLTLRADFLGNCVNFAGLPEAINRGIYLVPRMVRAQLTEAIVGPIEYSGATISNRLVNRLLNDLPDDDPDQLPLLQHELMRLWEVCPGAADLRLDLGLYEQIGGLTGSGALGQHLDELLRRAVARGEGEIVETVFRALTDTTPENRIVSRPTEFASLVESCTRKRPGCDRKTIEKIVDEFRAPGCHFILPPREIALEDRTIMDISHEAIIRKWPKLVEWARQEAREKEIAKRLDSAAERWQESDKKRDFLFRGAQLAAAEESFGSSNKYLPRLVREFLEASITLRQQNWREFANIRCLVAASAWSDEKDCVRSGHLFLKGAQEFESAGDAAVAKGASLAATLSDRTLVCTLSHDRGVGGAIFSRNGSRILTWSKDGKARLWALDQQEPIQTFAHEEPVNGAVFNGDESRVLTWSNDRTARLWALDQKEPIQTFLHKGPVYGAVFHTGGSRILTWSSDKAARLWALDQKEPIQTFLHKGPVYGAVFDTGGNRILTWSSDKAARFWALDQKEPIQTFLHKGPVYGAVFNTSGNRILTWSSDKAARLWALDQKEPIQTFLHKERERDSYLER